MENDKNKEIATNNDNSTDEKNNKNEFTNNFNNTNDSSKNQFIKFSQLNNQFSNNYIDNQNNVFNNLYPNNFFNPENQIMNPNNISYFNKQNLYNEYNNPKTNPNLSQTNQEQNQNKSTKSKNTQKRNNYIPKNLITFSSPYQSPNFPKKNQDHYMNLTNMYYSNFMSSSEHKNGLDSQNSSNNCHYNNSPNSPHYELENKNQSIKKDINFENKEKEKKSVSDNRYFKAFSHIFEANLDEVRETLTDDRFFKNSPPMMIDNVEFKLHNKTDTKGNIVTFRWKKFYTLELLCTKSYTSETFSSYTLTLINLKPVNIGGLQMTFRFYYNTCQNNTLFIIEYLLDKGIMSELFKEEFLDVDMNEICKNCQKIINLKKKENTHLSSIFFKAPKDFAWNTIMNLNNLKNINYLNVYNLEYISNHNHNDDEDEGGFKKGDAILIKRRKENKIFAELIIEEINEEKEKNDVIIKCVKLNGEKNDENISENTGNKNKNKNKKGNNVEIIEQKIHLIIKEIRKNLSYCEFRHIWNASISDKKVKILNFLKNNSLILFKKRIDGNYELMSKYNQNMISKENDNNENSVIINFFNLLCPINNNIYLNENK